MGYRNSNIDYAAMREDAEEQAAFNRKVGYRGKSNPFQEYNDAMSDRQDLIDQARQFTQVYIKKLLLILPKESYEEVINENRLFPLEFIHVN